MSELPKRSRDLNQWAKRMVDVATGTVADKALTPEKRAVEGLGESYEASPSIGQESLNCTMRRPHSA